MKNERKNSDNQWLFDWEKWADNWLVEFKKYQKRSVNDAMSAWMLINKNLADVEPHVAWRFKKNEK